jgi:alpha-L-fucosidase
MTICRQWAWKPDDQLKPLAQCVRTLIQTAGGDGNLLLNVGPMPDGRIEPRQAARLREIGTWLARYGEAIYGTRGGPFLPGPWGASICKGERVYLCVFRWPLALPDPGVRIRGARMLDGSEVAVDRTAEGELRIDVPPSARDDIATVVELTVDGPAFRIPPVPVPSASKAFGMRAVASNVFRDDPTYHLRKAFDDDEQTRWATDAGTASATLTVELEKPTEIGAARVVEGSWNRVRE